MKNRGNLIEVAVNYPTTLGKRMKLLVGCIMFIVTSSTFLHPSYPSPTREELSAGAFATFSTADDAIRYGRFRFVDKGGEDAV